MTVSILACISDWEGHTQGKLNKGFGHEATPSDRVAARIASRRFSMSRPCEKESTLAGRMTSSYAAKCVNSCCIVLPYSDMLIVAEWITLLMNTELSLQ